MVRNFMPTGVSSQRRPRPTVFMSSAMVVSRSFPARGSVLEDAPDFVNTIKIIAYAII
jgi:hypothetical protein